MATGPKLPRTPLEALSPDIIRPEPFLYNYYGPITAAIVCFSATCFANFVTKRPVFSGIQKHITISAIGAYIAKIVSDKRVEYYAERDAVYRHYIELHPEDFPPFERKKYADILEPWIPIR